MLLRGAPLKQGYTLAIGCYNLRFYAAESGPLVLRLVHSEIYDQLYDSHWVGQF